MQLSGKDTERHFSFLKKRMKTPKISRLKLQERFACKGWETCFMQLNTASDESECHIASSPTKYGEVPCDNHSVLENHPRRKPMLVEISNLKSVLNENRLGSLSRISKKPPQNVHNFVQKPPESVKPNQTHKRSKSELFNIQELEAVFETKKQKFNSEQKNCPSNFNEYKKLHKNIDSKNFDVKCGANKRNDFDFGIKDLCSPVSSELLYTSPPVFHHDKVEDLNIVCENSPKKLCSELFNLQGPKNPIRIEDPEHDKSLKTSNCNDFSSGVANNSEKEICHIKAKNYWPKDFTNNFSGEKQLNDNSEIAINIEDKPSPTKPAEAVICNPLANFSKENLKTAPTKLHRKRLGSEVFDLQNLEASFQTNKKYPHDSLSPLITYNSPLKPDNDNQQLSSLNKIKITPEVAIDSSFDNSKAKNSREEYLSEGKSVVLNNKAFMKTLQCSFQDKSFSSDKVSTWLQSLNWEDHSQSKNSYVECNEAGKKSVKNILLGGFAEQMLKVQRRERSDRVIWDHKINELKKKVAPQSVNFTLTSFLHFGQIIETKCTLECNNEDISDILYNGSLEAMHSNHEPSVENEKSEDFLRNTKTKVFIVLFKKNMFCKLHLKVGDMFTLYPPWQVLSVSSLPYPVILCTYFVEPIPKSSEITEVLEVASNPVIYTNTTYTKQCNCEKPIFSSTSLFNLSDLYGKSVCISARIQRIWKSGIMSSKVPNIVKKDFLSFSLLIQTKDNLFLELKIYSAQLPDSYLQFLSEAEGKCYRFCGIVMSHRYNLNRCPKLAKFIDLTKKKLEIHEGSSLSNIFCYQFMPTSVDKVPSDIPDEGFPAYCDYEIKPLSFLLKNDLNGAHFSCIGKIMFKNKEEFYISDESMLVSKLKKYYKVKFACLMTVLKQSIVGATVLIKEAMTERGCLFVDQFSKCEIVSNVKNNKLSSYQSRLKKIDLISFEHVLSPLTLSSKVKEFVLINGTISQVNESTAMSWLECCYCFKENLLEDSNSVIYCEDCCCTVPEPVLKVKMEVTMFSALLPCAEIKIQLLSSTVKRILKISEGNYLPQYNISDVLEKNTGDLCCYIKNIVSVDKLKVFHLTEIITS